MAVRAPHEFVNKTLSVSLWGMDASLKPFTATATTQRIAEDAVEVEFTRQLAVGEVVGLGYQGKRSRFRVLQSFLSGLSIYRVTLQDTGSTCMWKAEMASPDPIVRQRERRHEARLPVVGEAVLFGANGGNTSARLADISRTGCYVELHAPWPVGATLRVLLTLEGSQHCDITVIVRTSHPGIGMGMEILGFAATADQDRFRGVMQLLEMKPPAPVS